MTPCMIAQHVLDIGKESRHVLEYRPRVACPINERMLSTLLWYTPRMLSEYWYSIVPSTSLFERSIS
jgi:hypothetical protein